MHWKALDKLDSALYKGIAILMIVTHNFLHLFPLPKENEFAFYPDRFFDLFNLIINEPENIVRAILSFFGHYGVQIFIFLSAYGLSKKYHKSKPKYWPFIWQRIVTIYPAFILAIFAWLIVEGWFVGQYGILGPIKVLMENFKDLLLKLTLLSNFIPERSLSPVGPWWFVPFIFQFYFAFPFLLYLYAKGKGSILLLISTMSIIFSMIVGGEVAGLNIYYTILGHLPELCLGIYLARNDETPLRIPRLIILLVLAIYILGNIFEILWYVNPISFLVLLLAAFSLIVPKIRDISWLKSATLFFGTISMPLFLVNGFLRQPLITWAIEYNDWLYTIILCLVSLMISVLVAIGLLRTEQYLMAKIKYIYG